MPNAWCSPALGFSKRLRHIKINSVVTCIHIPSLRCSGLKIYGKYVKLYSEYISENTQTPVTGIWGCPLRLEQNMLLQAEVWVWRWFSAAFLCVPLYSPYSCACIRTSLFQGLSPAHSCRLLIQQKPNLFTGHTDLEAFLHRHTIPSPHSPKDKEQKGKISPRDNFKPRQPGSYFTIRPRFEGHL